MWNIPNTLTMARIFMAPLLVVVLLTEFPDKEYWGLAIFLLAASTDLLDAPSLIATSPGPPLIRTVLGAAATAAALVGRSRPSLGEAWELGPPDHHEV